MAARNKFWSIRHLKYLVKDESKAAKHYRAMGLYGLAKQEASHSKFFKKIVARRKKR